MRATLFFLFSTLVISACPFVEKEDKVQSILERAYEAHGGLENWRKLRELRFEKEYTLFRQDGSIEASAIQRHEYRFHPSFSATIRWKNEDGQHRIEHDASGTRKFVNDSLITEPEAIRSARNSALAARFTGTQPFQLLDPGTHFTYLGLDTLENGKEVEVLKAEYDVGSRDIWWHYFDVGSGRCVGNLIYHPPTYAYVTNLSFTNSSPFLFHQHRNTYRTDSLRNIRFLRAEYVYRNYEVILN